MKRFVVCSALLGGLALAGCVRPARPVPACRPLPEAPQPAPTPPDSLPGNGGRTSAGYMAGC